MTEEAGEAKKEEREKGGGGEGVTEPGELVCGKQFQDEKPQKTNKAKEKKGERQRQRREKRGQPKE